MVRLILFLVFIFSFTSSWGQKLDIKKIWAETNYNLDILFNQDLTVEKCYSSEKEFIGCMMAFEELLLPEPHHIKVNGLNLKITQLNKDEIPKTPEESMKFDENKRKSFGEFYRAITKNST